MKNGWDLGIMEFYGSKAKHLLKEEKTEKNDRMMMVGGGGGGASLF